MAGASPDAQIASAVTALTRSGGGVLQIPAGTYYFNKSISIPARTIVRGAGQGLTTLVFRGLSYPPNLFSGSSFGIESLTVRAPMSAADCNVMSIVSSYGCTYQAIQKKRNTEYSWVRDVDIRKPAADDPPPANWNRTAYVTLCTTAINSEASENLGVDNVFAEDCYNFITVTGQSNYTRATNIRFAYRDMSFLLRCGHNLVVENGTRHFLGTARINNRYYIGWQPGFLVGQYCPTSFTKNVYYGNMTSTSENQSWNE
ncbi:hypothetical protein GPECTOR_5g112 [Gonium pectorale]|uniref:Pectate lyase superfamily protein domain-containing protein n=1 Tax=Gonium pectorale TaxID=33097 RepID=A0A150GVY4_GONPE|nr:hypothetical protein GPECTOR_5g112 [Gonium pectorale]|eukprot:KXZ54001.1 hypothetical protein GPECTOR_5g112 [Gonium pectorale]